MTIPASTPKSFCTMTETLRNQNLAFFLTRGMSLTRWAQAGMLTREVAFYNVLASHFRKIYIFTYGDQADLQYRSLLAPNIVLINKKSKLPSWLYSFLIPLYHYSTLKICHVFKSNQLDGAWTAYLSKRITRQGKFILRTGFTWSVFLWREAKILSLLVTLIERWLYRHCDHALVTTRQDVQYLQKKYHLAQSKIDVLPNFVDTQLFRPMPKMPKYKNRLLFIGRLHPQKNLLLLLESIQGTKITLDIIGGGPLQAKLQDYAQRHKIRLNLLKPKKHAALPTIINRYLLFVLPSKYEGSPKSLLETMSCGLCCIASDIAPHREIIEQDKNGILTKPTVPTLRKAILKGLASPQKCQDLGCAARQTILKKYDLQILAQQELEIYEKIITPDAH